ncbi:exported hypothetical protein [Candidatus Accumulibacter aalborgensis]|uniref:Uncharacterized protein n=1 Tax=Candidatus Accumulibacter aalborgensis TaxID=1860102 RepID=A0A1A8XMH4_9PROT|nr:hypothetical protein [Candidatus Accumulibacter aalborgensis]SBT06374.1 exported hypothetical protein [Candidatus Accumulibacter aalborgensis]
MKAIFAFLALVVSTAASSACYLIYSPANELVWRGTRAPIPMDTVSLNDEVQKKVPQGHLVIINNSAAPCPRLDLTTPRKTMRDMAEEMKND